MDAISNAKSPRDEHTQDSDPLQLNSHGIEELLLQTIATDDVESVVLPELLYVDDSNGTERSVEREIHFQTFDIGSNFITLTSITALSAFESNAHLLLLSCEATLPRIFDPTDLHMPASLTPTQLQKQIPHPSFVDILPFPGVRNRLLRSLNVIELESLTEDLILDSFRVWGQVSWDSTGWEVSENFARKWWFLLDEQILATTNFWRRQRFEKEILRFIPENS